MKVFVLIPVHRETRADLTRAVQSVFAQAQADIQILLLLSGKAAPDTRACLEEMAEKNQNVHLQLSAQRLTASEARNALIDRALSIAGNETAAIAFLDSDDAWLPGHLTQFLGALAAVQPDDGAAVLYSAPYVQRQSRRVVHPNGTCPTLWSLTRQPLLLSSMILMNVPKDLRFRSGGAEDLVFYADALGKVDHFIAGTEESVVYDQSNWARKTLRFKLKRSYKTYRMITGSGIKAFGFLILFSAHYLMRRVFPGAEL